MTRLNIIVEGQTEEMFVNRVLKPYLRPKGIEPIPRLIFTGRKYGRVFRGGVTGYHNFKWDLVLWMREDRNEHSRFSTMLDLYGLPGDFPGQQKARRMRNPYDKVKVIENAMRRDIEDPRLIPYIQLHEFETLLLVAPEHFADFFIEARRDVKQLTYMIRKYKNPELINGGLGTAPSKRIAAFLPAYTRLKAVAGPFVASAIGIAAMRRKCPHFSEWLDLIEDINVGAPALD